MKSTSYELKPGTQIIYVPNHADGDANHPDCEPGFVERDSGERALCRFWLKPDLLELRTKANGEWAMKYNLVVKDTVPQIRVNKAMNDDRGSRLIQNLIRP